MSYPALHNHKMAHLTKFTDLGAPFYDATFRIFWLGRPRRFRQQVVRSMNLNGDETVLEVGCGTGELTSMLAVILDGRGKVVGVDVSARMIEVAERKASGQGNQIDYRVANSVSLPFADETFDVVVSSLVFHQLLSRDDRARSLSEIRRVLKPAGRYTAAECTRFTIANLIITHDFLLRRIPLFGPQLLEENGLNVIEEVASGRGITIILAGKHG